MRLPEPGELSHADHWRLFRHEVTDYYGGSSLSKLRYELHIQAVDELVGSLAEDRDPGGRTVLDVGCAQGFFTIALAERGYRTIGLEINPRFIGYARLKDDQGLAQFVQGSGTTIPFCEGTFDLVILGEIIEHVAEPEVLIREASRVLKNHGVLLVTTPNGASFLSKLPCYEERGNLMALRERQFGPDADDHLFLFRPGELRGLLARERMRVIRWRYGKTWLFNTFSLGILGRLGPRVRFLLDRLLTSTPWGRWSAENLFVLAKKSP